jgi:hypothetical protein
MCYILSYSTISSGKQLSVWVSFFTKKDLNVSLIVRQAPKQYVVKNWNKQFHYFSRFYFWEKRTHSKAWKALPNFKLQSNRTDTLPSLNN